MAKYLRTIIGLLFIIISAQCFANESSSTIIGISDLSIPNDKIPTFINNNNSTIDNSSLLKIEQQLPNISNQIRTQIATTYPWLKISNVDKDLLTIINTNFINESQDVDTSKISLDSSSSIQPDLFLVGQVSALNATNQETQIDNSNQYSDAYYVDIAVTFRLIKRKDKKIIATFTTAGQAGVVQFVIKPNKLFYNTDALQQAAIDDLVNSTVKQIQSLIIAEKLPNAPESQPLSIESK